MVKLRPKDTNPTPETWYFDDVKRALPSTHEESEIAKYFKGKCIFLTGATGFLGKIAIEKLLRTCPDIDGLFILCRDKKGRNMHDRTEEIFNDVLFKKLHDLYPKCRHKVTPIKGDVSEEGLGISPEDRQLLTSKVNVIFHIAATVRFDEKIRTAMNINVRGTRELLKLGRECKNLDSLIHTSTAFSHCVRPFIDEQYYDMPISYDELNALVETKTDEELEKMRVFEPWPNTYTFTKAMAEDVIRKEAGNLPITIFRPSIVVSTYQEPLRGWIDNVYGPTGAVAGAGLGILRSLHCNPKNVAEIVPVDWVVNALIATAFKTYQEYSLKNGNRISGPPKIYNFVSSVENPITWEEFMAMNAYYGVKVPSNQALWYYCLTLNKYKILHTFYIMFLQWLPAFLIDGASVLIGKEAQLTKIYKKIDKFTDVISYFSIRRWYFKNKNIQDLWTDLSSVDRKLFPFDIKLIDWDWHSQMNIFGVRTYIIKESPDTLPGARKKWQKLFIAHEIIKYTFYLITLRVVYGILSTLWTLFV